MTCLRPHAEAGLEPPTLGLRVEDDTSTPPVPPVRIMTEMKYDDGPDDYGEDYDDDGDDENWYPFIDPFKGNYIYSTLMGQP